MFPPEDASLGDSGANTEVDAGADAGEIDAGSDAGADAGEVNAAPVAQNLSLMTDEDVAQSDALQASDADGDALTYEIVAAPEHGTLALDTATGELTYTPDENYAGEDAFTFRASDGKSASNVATVSIDVLPVNDAPTAVGALLDAEEDTDLSFTLSAVDVDGDQLDYEIVDAPQHGVLSGTAADRTYTPDENYFGTDSFTFRVRDGMLESGVVTVDVDVLSINDAPSLVTDSVLVVEGASSSVLVSSATSVLDNDSDVEGDALSVTTTASVTPSAGTVTLSADGTFSYTHDGSEAASDSFSYEVCDDGTPSRCSSVSVDVTVTPVDDAPIAVADALTVAEGATVTLLDGSVASVLANDSDAEGETLTVSTTPLTVPQHGTLTLNADGTFSYTHDGSETATDSFVYEVCDAAPALCASATVSIVITPVNESPVASSDAITVAEGGTVSLLEGGSDSVLDNDSDPENDALTAMVVTPGPAHGTLTLNPDGTFSYTHDGSETSSDSFSYTACDDDSSALCDTGTVSITIDPVNDAPLAGDDAIAVLEGGTATTLEGGGSDLRDNDSDAEDDAVQVVATAVTGPEHGTLTLNPDGSFSYTHDGSETSSDSFEYQLCETAAPTRCATATVSITIDPVNDAPSALDDAIVMNEASTATDLSPAGSSLLENDSDAEADALTVTTTPVTAPQHGTLTLNADGSFSYTHDGTETASDSFVYEVCDPSDACDTATVAITIAPVNEAPSAVDDAFSVAEGGTFSSVVDAAVPSVLDNDSDPDGDTLTATVDTAPSNGQLTLNPDGTYVYVHDGSETESDSFVYRTCDDGVPELCTTGTVAITITPVNDAPVPMADALVVAEGGVQTVLSGGGSSVLDNDSDPEGATLATTLITAPTFTSAFTLNADGSFSYTHDGGESVTDSFVYRVCDGGTPDMCSDASVSVTITPVNDAPQAQADAISVAEAGVASVLTTLASNLTANDVDPDDTTFSVQLSGAGVQHGALTVNADGTFSYTHDGSENFSDSFDYEVCDDDAACDTATVTITITPVNDTPAVNDDAASVSEGGSVSVLIGGSSHVLDNDTDADSTLTAVSLVTGPSHAQAFALNADGTFSYTHDGSETESDSFVYQACDGGTPDACDTATVAISITPVNDAPVGVADSMQVTVGQTVTMLSSSATSVLDNDTDAEGAALIAEMLTAPSHGAAFVLNTDGTFSYTHDGSASTSATFDYRACEQAAPTVCSPSTTVTITITPLNNLPVAMDDAIAVNEGQTSSTLVGGATSLLSNDTDAESAALTLTTTAVTEPEHGALTLNADGSFSYVHDGSETESDSFEYEVCETATPTHCDTATVSISITPVNDAPTAVADAIATSEGGTTSTLSPSGDNLLANDSDAEGGALTLTLSPTVAPAFGSVTLNADGTFSYTHDGSESPTDSFTYQICDDALSTPACATATVTITISAVNDAPLAQADAFTVIEGGTATLLATLEDNLTANDFDAENDTLTVALSGPTTLHGVLTLSADGTFSYVHDGSDTLTDGFSYEVCDGASACDTASVSITITPVNDAPVATDDAIAVNEGATATTLTPSGAGDTSVLSNDSDSDSSTLAVNTVVTGPAFASAFTLNADGSFSYAHDGGASLSDSFEYEVCDDATPTPACDTATVTITIAPVNDVPVANADAIAVDEGATVSALSPSGSSVLDNDSDEESATLTATLQTSPAYASSFALNADGSFSYTHDGSETLSDSFTYVACETAAPVVCSAAATVTITVTSVNDLPIAGDDAITVDEGATATVLSNLSTSLLANDSDADGDALTLTTVPVTPPAHGALTLADGSFSYTHDGGETTADSFVYRVCETAVPGNCDDATVSIVIVPANDAPTAGTYSYGNVVGNTLYTVRAAAPNDSSTLLGSGDSDIEGDTLTISAVDTSSLNGGTISHTGAGAFTYLPPAGHLGADSFTYDITDDGTPAQTTTVTVNLTVVGPLVWYVDNAHGGASTGRSSEPFTTLAPADAAATPIADTRIYVAQGSGSYTGTVSLNAGQTLIGAGVAFAPSATVSFGAGASRPLITTASASAVTLTSNNTVTGINVTNTAGDAITGVAVSGALLIDRATLSASAGAAINLTGGAALSLSNLGAINAARGLTLTSLSSLTTLSTEMSITASAGHALDINGGSLDATFASLSSSSSPSFGVRLQNVTRTAGNATVLTSTTTTVSNPAGDGIVISGTTGTGPTFNLGNCSVTQAGTGGGLVGDAYAFTNNPTANILMTMVVDPVTANGRGLYVSNSGSLVTGAMPALITATGGAAIHLHNTIGNVAGLGRYQFTALTSTNSSAHGVRLDTLSSAVTVTGTTTVTGALSESVRSDDTTHNLSFGNVTVNTRRNAGIVIDDADGVSRSVTFGTLTIPNPNARAENALQIQNSAANVSVTTANITGASTAVRLLDNTGSFTLNSSGGVAGGGGTIAGSTASAIVIDNADNITLDDLIIANATNLGDHGIDAFDVTNFTLRNSEITRVGNTNGDHGVLLQDVTGTVRIDNVVITQVAETGIELVNTSGTTNLRVLSTDITQNDANTFCGGGPCSGNGLSVFGSGTANITLLVEGSLFERIDGEGVQVVGGTGTTIHATIMNSTFQDSVDGDSAIELNQVGGSFLFDVSNNTISDFSGHVVVATANTVGAMPGAVNFDGTIRNNTITANPFLGNHGIHVLADIDDGVTFVGRANITGNTVNNANARGISSVVRGSTAGAALHTRLLGNTVNTTGLQGYFVQAQNATVACARVGSGAGTVTTDANDAIATTGTTYALNKAASATLQLAGVAASPTAELAASNLNAGAATASAGITMTGTNACQVATLPNQPPL